MPREYLTSYNLTKAIFLLRHRSRTNYFRKKGFVFVHIPKNAGTSICKALGLYSFEHYPLAYYAEHIEAPAWDELYKFAVFRNPVDRIVSVFNHVKRTEHYDSFRDYFRRYSVDPYETTDAFVLDWLDERTMASTYFTGSQRSFIDLDGVIGVNAIYSVDRLDVMCQDLSAQLGRRIDQYRLNTSSKDTPRRLGDEAEQKVRRLYQQDLELYERVTASGRLMFDPPRLAE